MIDISKASTNKTNLNNTKEKINYFRKDLKTIMDMKTAATITKNRIKKWTLVLLIRLKNLFQRATISFNLITSLIKIHLKTFRVTGLDSKTMAQIC